VSQLFAKKLVNNRTHVLFSSSASFCTAELRSEVDAMGKNLARPWCRADDVQAKQGQAEGMQPSADPGPERENPASGFAKQNRVPFSLTGVTTTGKFGKNTANRTEFSKNRTKPPATKTAVMKNTIGGTTWNLFCNRS
jgi:hypothetical protein